MALTEDSLTKFFEILAASKLPSELSELLDPTASHFVVIQSGTADAQKISLKNLRGSKGTYNANTNSPNLYNGSGVEGDFYIVGSAGTRDFGSGSINLSVDDVITYLDGKWRKTGYAIKRQTLIDLLGFEPENPANRGQANGYVPLNNSTKIDAVYLPAYVEEIVEGDYIDATNFKTGILKTPVNDAFTAGSGTLAAGTYYYRVSAIDANGETIPSAETSFTLNAQGGVNVNWGAVTGATGYKIYGRSTGAEELIASVGTVTTYLDDGSITPAGAMPTTNTTGYIATPATNKLYLDTSTSEVYRWSGSQYVNIVASPGSTDSVTEGSVNLYFTNARVLATTLSGLALDNNDVIDGDSVITAFGKLQGQINDLVTSMASFGVKKRTRKLITNTTQYTVVAADFTDFELVFNADTAGAEIDVIINTGVCPDTEPSTGLQIISIDDNVLAFSGTATLTPSEGSILKSANDGTSHAIIGIKPGSTVDNLGVFGSLQGDGTSSTVTKTSDLTNDGDNTTDPFIDRKDTFTDSEGGTAPAVLNEPDVTVTNITSTSFDATISSGGVQKILTSNGWKDNDRIQSIQPGTNISIDNTDPLNPIVSASTGAGTSLRSDVIRQQNFGGTIDLYNDKWATYTNLGNWAAPSGAADLTTDNCMNSWDTTDVFTTPYKCKIMKFRYAFYSPSSGNVVRWAIGTRDYVDGQSFDASVINPLVIWTSPDVTTTGGVIYVKEADLSTITIPLNKQVILMGFDAKGGAAATVGLQRTNFQFEIEEIA